MVEVTRKKALSLKGKQSPKLISGGSASNEVERMAKIEATLAEVATKSDTKRIESQMVKMASATDLDKFAKKSDLEKLANKRDLERFASFKDMDNLVQRSDLERVVKKSDLDKFAKKTDLKLFATKEDIERLEATMVSKEDAQRMQESIENLSSKADSKGMRIWVIIGTICVLALTAIKVAEIIQS